MAKLSVIVPIYNSQKSLHRCLDSILSQSFKDFEVICVNDGSTDESGKILQEYASQDERIKLINKINGGLSSARNSGMEVANGSYLSFVDSDDYIANHMFEKMIHVMEEDHVDLVGCGTNVIYEAWHSLKVSDDHYYKVRLGRNTKVNGSLFRQIDVSSWNKIFKKDLIEKYHIRFPEGYWYEDASFIWSYLPMCSKISYVEDKFYNYIRYPSSIMGLTFGKKTVKVLDHLKIVKMTSDFLANQGKLVEYIDAFMFYTVDCFWFSYRYLPLKKKYLSFLELHATLNHIDRKLRETSQNKTKLNRSHYYSKVIFQIAKGLLIKILRSVKMIFRKNNEN